MKTDVMVLLLALTVFVMVEGEEVNQTLVDSWENFPTTQPEIDHDAGTDLGSQLRQQKLKINRTPSDEDDMIIRKPENIQGSKGAQRPLVDPGSKVTQGSEVEKGAQEETEKTRSPGGVVDEEFFSSIEGLSTSIKVFLIRKDLSKAGLLDGARTIVVNFPQSDLFGSLIGLSGETWANPLASILFFGWPLLLLLLYVALIVVYPNRRSDNIFEKHLSSMVESWSHMMYVAEDNFLNFMEDMTDPDGSSHDDHQAGDDIPYATHTYDYSDPYNRQAVFYSPTAYYDEYGEHVDAEYVDGGYDGEVQVDDWGSPKPESIFVDPSTDFKNPVVSFSSQGPEPLREEYDGDILRLTNDFNIQNEISQKDQQNFLSVVLGTQYQHGRPSGSLVDQDVVRGSVAADFSHHPEPPRRYRPSSPSTGSFENTRADEDVDPRFRNETTNSSRFRPSALLEETSAGEDDWIAGPRPSRENVSSSRTSQVKRQSKITFPGQSDPRATSNRDKTNETKEAVQEEGEEGPSSSSSIS
ncbi:uncharacterized protein [Panulirus ornatus]|uniref:uncharacterized protein isoform X2 n=1 Tax=Panulirus ornatus TaxID=150431 RepID=UPI003A8B5ADF